VVRLEEGPPHLEEVEVADRRDHDVQLVLEQRRRGDRRPRDRHRASHCRWWWWRCLDLSLRISISLSPRSRWEISISIRWFLEAGVGGRGVSAGLYKRAGRGGGLLFGSVSGAQMRKWITDRPFKDLRSLRILHVGPPARTLWRLWLFCETPLRPPSLPGNTKPTGANSSRRRIREEQPPPPSSPTVAATFLPKRGHGRGRTGGCGGARKPPCYSWRLVV
jgi:hypothetical protein